MSKIDTNLDAFIGISDAMTLFGSPVASGVLEAPEVEASEKPAKRDWAELRLLEGLPVATLDRLRSQPGD